MPFTLRQLSYFVAAGDTGSVTLASQRMNISQPAISAAIAQLEEDLGTQLFLRHHAQGLSLTAAGRSLMREAQELLRQADAIYTTVAELDRLPRGDLAVGWFTTLAPTMMPELIKRFMSDCPEAIVRADVQHQEGLIDALRRAQIDLALTYDVQLPLDIDFQPLASLPPYVLVGTNHPLATRSSVSLKDLAPLPMVLLDLPLSREYFHALFMAEQLEPTIAWKAEQPEVVRSLVANDYGYAIYNVRPRATTAIDGKAVVSIPLSGHAQSVRIGLATLKALRPTRVAQAFIDHCRQHVTQRSIPGMAPPLTRRSRSVEQ
jgi:DNA-binding transcriptional LysR family regulator